MLFSQKWIKMITAGVMRLGNNFSRGFRVLLARSVRTKGSLDWGYNHSSMISITRRYHFPIRPCRPRIENGRQRLWYSSIGRDQRRIEQKAFELDSRQSTPWLSRIWPVWLMAWNDLTIGIVRKRLPLSSKSGRQSDRSRMESIGQSDSGRRTIRIGANGISESFFHHLRRLFAYPAKLRLAIWTRRVSRIMNTRRHCLSRIAFFA